MIATNFFLLDSGAVPVACGLVCLGLAWSLAALRGERSLPMFVDAILYGTFGLLMLAGMAGIFGGAAGFLFTLFNQ